MSLRVAVNLLFVNPGRVGGSEEYLARQLLGLADPGVSVAVFCHPSFRPAHPELARYETVSMPMSGDHRGPRIVAEHTWLMRRTYGFDLTHHGGGTMPLVSRRPAVLTVHDLQYLTFPHYFSVARRAYLGVMLPSSVRRATVVATPSDYVRRTVVDAFSVDPDDVVVVPHGIPPISPPDDGEIARVRAATGIGDRPYVVYPAITHPHKAHRLLVEALALSDDRDLGLVLVGGEGANEADVRAAIGASSAADRILRTGRVDEATRDALVAGAEVMAFPSEYEGFGAPLVEAMELGVPVVCSAHPAVTEVVGGAGNVVEAATPEAWAHAIAATRRDRDRLIAAGRVRREAFTPEVSGAALAAAYRHAVDVWEAGS